MGTMMLDAVLAQFVKHSPITVMAQLGLERVLEPEWMDQLFEEQRGRQYKRELLFSTTVDIMALVALGLRPSVHAAARARQDLAVSLSALYEKINHTEPALGRALVRESAQRLAPVVEPLKGQQPPACPGYRTRIVDGNCLAPSDKRLKALRPVRSAALPGRSLVVYEQPVDLHGPDGGSLRLRRIEIHLDKPTGDGERTISLLTDLPAHVSAIQIAALYRRRWSIGASSQGRITQSVKVRPRLKDSRSRSVGGTVARNQDGEALRQSLGRRFAKLQVAA